MHNRDYITELPSELMQHLFSFLSGKELLALQAVSEDIRAQAMHVIFRFSYAETQCRLLSYWAYTKESVPISADVILASLRHSQYELSNCINGLLVIANNENIQIPQEDKAVVVNTRLQKNKIILEDDKDKTVVALAIATATAGKFDLDSDDAHIILSELNAGWDGDDEPKKIIRSQAFFKLIPRLTAEQIKENSHFIMFEPVLYQYCWEKNEDIETLISELATESQLNALWQIFLNQYSTSIVGLTKHRDALRNIIIFLANIKNKLQSGSNALSFLNPLLPEVEKLFFEMRAFYLFSSNQWIRQRVVAGATVLLPYISGDDFSLPAVSISNEEAAAFSCMGVIEGKVSVEDVSKALSRILQGGGSKTEYDDRLSYFYKLHLTLFGQRHSSKSVTTKNDSPDNVNGMNVSRR